MAMRMITRAMRRFSEENYSNPDDFPRQFAKGIIWIPVLHVAISWTSTFIGTLGSLSIGMLLLSVLGVTFLIGAPAPHRTLDVERLESGELQMESVEMQAPSLPEPEIEPDSFEEETLSQDRKDEIMSIIRHHVEDEQAYLDSHLTLELGHEYGHRRQYEQCPGKPSVKITEQQECSNKLYCGDAHLGQGIGRGL